jgi:hypothetical protein
MAENQFALVKDGALVLHRDHPITRFGLGMGHRQPARQTRSSRPPRSHISRSHLARKSPFSAYCGEQRD